MSVIKGLEWTFNTVASEYDKWNPTYLDGYIYTQHFLMYQDDEPRTLYGNYLFKFENGRVTEIYQEA